MAVTDVQGLVAGLGPGGAAALARLRRAGVSAVGLEARGAVAERWNMVRVSSATQGIIKELELGNRRWRNPFYNSTASIRTVEGKLRGIAAALDAPAHYDTPIESVELLRNGGFLVRAAGSDDAWRATYLIDSTGGRLPMPEGAGLPLRQRPGQDAYVTSLWGYENGVPHRWGEVTDPRGDIRPAIVSREAGTGTQLFTRMGADPLPDDLVAFDDEIRKLVGIRSNRLTEPQVIHIRPAGAAAARKGNLLLTGDAIARLHPATSKGLNLAVLDGYEAAGAVARAVKSPRRAEAALARYDERAYARHQAALHESERSLFNADGTPLLSNIA